MKRVSRLHVVLWPSRRAAVWFTLPTVATTLLLWTLPWPWWLLLCVNLVLMTAAYGMWRRLMPQGRPGGIEALTLGADRRVQLYFSDKTASGPGEGLPARVLDDTCLGDTFLTIVWRAETEKRSRTLFLLPDMMSGEDWRRLRVLLQHGREITEVAIEV